MANGDFSETSGGLPGWADTPGGEAAPHDIVVTPEVTITPEAVMPEAVTPGVTIMPEAVMPEAVMPEVTVMPEIVMPMTVAREDVTPTDLGASPLGADFGATLPALRPRGRSARAKIAIAATTGLVLVAAAIVVVLLTRTQPMPPVLRPTGLRAGSVTYTTMQINWSRPRTGPLPRRYLIFRNGSQVGSVSGRVTTFQTTGLSPNTPYEYQVMAIRQHHRSPRSADLNVSTLAPPPLSKAMLTGAFTVNYSHVTSYGYVHYVRRLPSDDWNIVARCSSGPCVVVLYGTFWSASFTATLHPSGTTYEGTAVIKKFNKCSDITYDIPLYLTYHLTIRSAVAHRLQWTVSSWNGTLQATQPASACVATQITAKTQGTPG